MRAQVISKQRFVDLRGSAQVLEQDSHGEKVLLLSDGNILKMFRRKRLVSSALWYPYAQRFVDNAESLCERGVIVPKVIALYRVPELNRDAVHYHPVPGLTLRQHFRQDPAPENLPSLRDAVTQFILSLFSRGIYFRSLHLGNIVQQPDGTLALIDISDLRCQKRPLSVYMRKRNAERIVRIAEPGETSWIDMHRLTAPNN